MSSTRSSSSGIHSMGTMQDDALRVKQLENKLAAVTAERNALEQDLEQMCLSRGSHMFSSSYVLAERLKYLEAEVKQQRNQLVQLTTARDNALEDILQVKALKRAADQGWQQERGRVAALEQELAFFQSALSEAISARDSASYEASVNKQRLEVQEAELEKWRAEASAHGSRAQELQQQLAAAQQQLGSSQAELGSIKVHLRQAQSLQQQIQRQQQQLAEAQADKVAAEARSSSLVHESQVMQQQLVAAQQDCRRQQAAAEEASATAADLRRQIQGAHCKQDATQALLEQTSAALVACQAALKQQQHLPLGRLPSSSSSSSDGEGLAEEEEAEVPLEQQLVQLRSSLQAADEFLRQAAQDKLNLQQELQHAQVAADEASTDETIRQLQERNQQLNRLLAQATAEKVEALMQAAAFQNNSSGADLLESASHSSGGPASLKAMGPGAAPGVCLSPLSAAVSPAPEALADVAAGAGHRLSVSGNGSSSLKAMLTPPTPGRGLLAAETAAAELAAGTQARCPAKPSQQQQQPAVLPETCSDVKSLPGRIVQGVPVGPASTSPNRDATAAPADRHLHLPTPQLQEACRQQRLQLQQGLRSLELLLHFAWHCRVVLDQVQAAAVADAAVAAAGPGQARRAKPGRGASSPAPATADVLQALADAAKDLDGSRHLLLGARSASAALPPQHDSLLTPPHSSTPPDVNKASCRDWVAALIQLAAAPGPDGNTTTAVNLGAAGAGAGANAAGTGSTSGISAAVLGGLTQMFGSQSTVTGGVRGSADSRDGPSLQGCGGHPGPQQPLTLCTSNSAAVQAAAGSEGGGISRVMPVIGPSAGQTTLDLAMQIQLLADGCVLALQQVQKITALSNLMGDCSW